MNHLKIYNFLIKKVNSQNRKKLNKLNEKYIYYERHHILPICLNGNNEKENLVLLTAKEHYVAHKLLTYIYPNNRKMVVAFYMMSHFKKYKKYASSRDVEYAKLLKLNTPISKETRKKISNSLKGKVANNKGVAMSPEQKKKISAANRNKKRSEKTKKQISETLKKRMSDERRKEISEKLKGNNNHLGHKHSDKTKQKIREKRKNQIMKKGWKHSKETKEKISQSLKKLSND